MEKLQTYLGTLAIEKGYIKQEQLSECIMILDSQDSQQNIEEILQERGYLQEEQIKKLQKYRQINIKKMEAQATIDYIKKMKLVDEDKLQNCLRVQNEAAQKKTYIPLDMILVSHGILSQAQMDQLMQENEVQRIVRQAICADDPRRTGLVGRVLGGYEILSKIAAGGMGVVFQALQLEVNRKVALKILFEKFASNKKHLSQFFREARLSAILNHPNLVHIFEMGQDQGFFYYSMELVEGFNFGDYIKEKGRLKPMEAMDTILQAARGLEHIHSYDIIHLDIKPSNFIIRNDGILKIMDLGLARRISKSPKQKATMGTPYYMSPELISNPEKADQRADIYALGVSFYRVLTGEHPITGSDAKEILRNLKEQTPKPVDELVPGLPKELDRIIQKMIAKDPDKRYQHMTEVIADLERVLIMDEE